MNETLTLTTNSIIALHGLNPRGTDNKQHAFDTWRKPSGPMGRLWLRDDLPKYTPNSRIFLYEYNSSLIFGDRKRFFHSADELLEDIRSERISVSSYPGHATPSLTAIG